MLSVITSSAVLLLMGISPLLFSCILRRNFNRLPRPSTKSAIGSLYLAIRDQDRFALAYSSVFMFRRLIFIAITFGLSSVPGLQIHLFAYTSMFYVIYLGLVMPHESFSVTGQELANETVLMLSCYHFILFTGLVDDV